MEQDKADWFGVSQSTVSRITNTWINFIYLQLKQIPLWSPKQIIELFMQRVFTYKHVQGACWDLPKRCCDLCLTIIVPGSISDKELVMTDKGFDIEDDLIPIGVKLNIPPFLRGTSLTSKKPARLDR